VNLDALLALTPEGTLLPTRPLAPEERAAIRERIPPGSAARTDLIRRLLRAMDAAAFDALTEAAVDARAASGLTWLDEPWATWGRLLNDEGDARQPRYVPTQATLEGETTRRQTECGRLLRMLSEAGPRGVLNTDLEADEIGRRYSARLHELREAGHRIDTLREGNRLFRFVLRAHDKAA
jgi:hypothetical protein